MNVLTNRARWAALLVLALASMVLTPGVVRANEHDGGEHEDGSYTIAVIGDIPYGPAQIANFPNVVSQINADKDTRLVIHLGDIKSGSSVCSDTYFQSIKTEFDKFVDPLVYTPGDNEWTDCHRVNNGGYNPLERLAAIRTLFFPKPGKTLGQHSVGVKSLAKAGFPENVMFARADIGFGVVHIVGSNNSLVPWSGLGFAAPTVEQLAEVNARTAAVESIIRSVFRNAREEDQRAVVLALQADMFDSTIPGAPGSLVFAQWSGFQPIVRLISEESARFGKPVYLFDGDSHVFHVDHPLAQGSGWLAFYGVNTPAPNLTRITVDGSTGANNWLKVTLHEEGPNPLTWEKIPFAP